MDFSVLLTFSLIFFLWRDNLYSLMNFFASQLLWRENVLTFHEFDCSFISSYHFMCCRKKSDESVLFGFGGFFCFCFCKPARYFSGSLMISEICFVSCWLGGAINLLLHLFQVSSIDVWVYMYLSFYIYGFISFIRGFIVSFVMVSSKTPFS